MTKRTVCDNIEVAQAASDVQLTLCTDAGVLILVTLDPGEAAALASHLWAAARMVRSETKTGLGNR